MNNKSEVFLKKKKNCIIEIIIFSDIAYILTYSYVNQYFHFKNKNLIIFNKKINDYHISNLHKTDAWFWKWILVCFFKLFFYLFLCCILCNFFLFNIKTGFIFWHKLMRMICSIVFWLQCPLVLIISTNLYVLYIKINVM